MAHNKHLILQDLAQGIYFHFIIRKKYIFLNCFSQGLQFSALRFKLDIYCKNKKDVSELVF